MLTAGTIKKVQFYAALALLLGALQAEASELVVPLAEVQQQLAEKVDEAFSRKLEECREKERRERNYPRFPVRLAEEPAKGQAPLAGAELTAL